MKNLEWVEAVYLCAYVCIIMYVKNKFINLRQTKNYTRKEI